MGKTNEGRSLIWNERIAMLFALIGLVVLRDEMNSLLETLALSEQKLQNSSSS